MVTERSQTDLKGLAKEGGRRLARKLFFSAVGQGGVPMVFEGVQVKVCDSCRPYSVINPVLV